jgi:hypothetical protein
MALRLRQGFLDGLGNLTSFDSPYGIVRHKKTGDLFVADANLDSIQKLSRTVIDGKEEWMVSSIRILLDRRGQEYFGVAVFNDSLFLISTSGRVVRSSLDGKVASVIAEHTFGSQMGIAADANGVYVTLQKHVVIKIELPGFFWSTEHHQMIHYQKRHLIRQIVVASLCNTSSNSTSPLTRLPREILFHVLSFLDSHAIGVQQVELPAI